MPIVIEKRKVRGVRVGKGGEDATSDEEIGGMMMIGVWRGGGGVGVGDIGVQDLLQSTMPHAVLVGGHTGLVEEQAGAGARAKAKLQNGHTTHVPEREAVRPELGLELGGIQGLLLLDCSLAPRHAFHTQRSAPSRVCELPPARPWHTETRPFPQVCRLCGDDAGGGW